MRLAPQHDGGVVVGVDPEAVAYLNERLSPGRIVAWTAVGVIAGGMFLHVLYGRSWRHK